MSNKHFIAPIVEQWIEKLKDRNNTSFVKDNYAKYLEETRRAIDSALAIYNMDKDRK